MSQKIDPKQIKSPVAKHGDVLVYDATTGTFKASPNKYKAMRYGMIFGS